MWPPTCPCTITRKACSTTSGSRPLTATSRISGSILKRLLSSLVITLDWKYSCVCLFYLMLESRVNFLLCELPWRLRNAIFTSVYVVRNSERVHVSTHSHLWHIRLSSLGVQFLYIDSDACLQASKFRKPQKTETFVIPSSWFLCVPSFHSGF